MASIQTKGNTHYVVLSVKNIAESKYETQWLPCETLEAAKELKEKIEVEQKKAKEENRKTFVTKATRTVEHLARQYIRLVGKQKWGVSTYQDYISRYENYVMPHIGTLRVWECSTLVMDEYFDKLKRLKAVQQAGKPPKRISAKVVNEVHKFLKAMFNQALEWDMVDKNPCRKRNSTLPDHTAKKRTFWTRNQFIHACECAEKSNDLMLMITMQLSVSTTMREGEICGLQWDKCFLSEEDITKGDCRVVVDKELIRVPKYSMKELENKAVKFVFPNHVAEAKTSLVLKDPKSKTSNRTIWLPPTVARLLLKLKAQQELNKQWYGECYSDYGLVICWDNGRPFEGKRLNTRLKDLIAEFALPPVVFHSIRHTSTTYKLKYASGDVKLVQGDTGHANSQMVTDVYAEIVDEDRKYNAERFETEFYGALPSQPPKKEKQLSTQDLTNLLAVLQSKPEVLAGLLAATNLS